MTLPALINTIRLQLHRDGKISNEQIQSQCNNVESVYWLRQIRDQLIFENFAEDDQQLGLLLVQTGKLLPEPEFDIFISYARKDNINGRIDEIYQQIGRRFFERSGRILRIFYDNHDIRGGDDWSRRLADGLRQSKVMVAVLSPNYFNSEWCQKEWEQFYQQEIGLSLFGEGIAPVYVIQMPEFLKGNEHQLNNWQRDLRKRQLIDFGDWFEKGESALIREDIQQRFRELDELCYKRLERIDRVRQSRHNLPRHFRQFLGREDDIRLIQQTLNREQPPVVALWGMAGIGKSALAMEYGLAFADRYAGGRFQLPSANMISIFASLKDLLIRELGITFTEEENKDDQLAYSKIKLHFEEPFRKNANYHTLLIFDNVDTPQELFSFKTIQKWLPEGVHVLLTTRQYIENDKVGLLVSQRVGELSEGASLRLLGSYRPFISDDDKQAAQAISRRLGGYTLALNVTGVFLANASFYSYAKILSSLEQDKIQMLDQMAKLDEVSLYNYSTKVVGELLAPQLLQLTTEQRLVVEYAALLPPDTIVLPWLEELLKIDFPNLNMYEHSPFVLITPWERIVRELKKLGIWIETDDARIISMHRIMQEVIIGKLGYRQSVLQNELVNQLKERLSKLTSEWHLSENRWEIQPITDSTEIALMRGFEGASGLVNNTINILFGLGLYTKSLDLLNKGISIAEKLNNSLDLPNLYHSIAVIFRNLGKFAEAKHWTEKSIKFLEKNQKINDPMLSTVYSHMAMLMRDLGKSSEAEKWMEKAFVIDNEIREKDHPDLGIHYSNMAMIQMDLKRLEKAEELIKKAINICKLSISENDPLFASLYTNMALIRMELGALTEAEQWMIKALRIDDEIYDNNHPLLGKNFSNMAVIQRALGKYNESAEWMRKAIKIDEANFDATHPHLSLAYSNLGTVLFHLGKREEACKLWLKSYWIHHDKLGASHPHAKMVLKMLNAYCPQCFNTSITDMFYKFLGGDVYPPKRP